MAVKKQDLKTISQTIALTWKVDPRFVVTASLLNILGGLIPIALSYITKSLIDHILVITTTSQVITVTVVGLLAFRYVLEGVTDFQRAFLYQYVQRMTRYKIQNYLNLEMSQKISLFDVDHFENPTTQNLINKVQRESFGRIPSYMSSIFFTITYGTTLIGSFIALTGYGLWVPVLAIAVSIPRYQLRRETTNLTWSLFNNQTPEQRLLGMLSDNIQKELSVIEIRLAGARDHFLKRIKQLQDKLFTGVGKPLKRYLGRIWIPILLESGFMFVMVYLKLPLVLTGIITIGSILFLIQMTDQIITNTQNVNEQIADLLEDSLYAKNYFDLMALPELIKERQPGHVFETIKPPTIAFQNIGFSYPNGAQVLKKISFTINPGEHLAIVGPNGAGKTTLIKLLLRFYDPTKGAITINDFDLKDLRRDNWYRFIGTLFQSFGKYSLTVKENIAFSNIDKPDQEKIRRAAQMSGAAEFIEKFPKKYDQQLGREFDGEELSVGQWQKLALARAFYEEAPVLILDEPTSAIDAEAEAEIFDNLNKVYKDKTVIFISHRFSTVRNADKIIVLKDGEIAEEGTHESLLAKKGIYERMFKKQAKGYID